MRTTTEVNKYDKWIDNHIGDAMTGRKTTMVYAKPLETNQ